MSCFSDMEELEGIAFFSPVARELAEKKVLQQRHEDELKRQEEEQQRLAEEAAKREKAERIEARRLKAEQRLQELAQRRAEEENQEAERLRQLQIQQKQEEAERKKQEEEERKRQEEAERRRQEQLRKEQEEAERERQRKLEEEREEKKRQRLQHQREQEIAAEKRWLKIQAESGNIKVTKKDGVFVVTSLKPTVTVDDTMFTWLSQARDLEGVPYDVVETKREEDEAPKPRALLAPRKPGPEGIIADRERLKRMQKDKENANKALLEYEARDDEQLRRGLGDILSGLDGPHRHAALLDLYTLHAAMIALHGVDGYEKHLKDPNLNANMAKVPDLMHEILEEAPGNIFAMAILGMMQFAGEAVLRHRVANMNIIPHDYEEWVGWMVGSRLFFEYLEWWNTAPENEQPDTPWTLRDEERMLAVPVPDNVKTGAKEKMTQLISAYLAPGLVQRIMPDLMAKLPLAYCRLDKTQDELEKMLRDFSEDEEFGFDASDSTPEGMGYKWERQQYLLKEAERTAHDARRNVEDLRVDLEAAQAFVETSTKRKQDLEEKVEDLKTQEDALRKEQKELREAIDRLSAQL
ncbi:hypothetical protein PTSG_08203 [Salpingoeca rosetta]|uniref:Uncharacterized protein n=1 Tax=Salpingoeca rosetta (strain ATCC 50818 / BSB-021) TaxID=946362 RepID=F2UIA6_SALR5|nr:uncharacterized protein PTSG_08203 [Salpingoeca rosetta]EGD76855.1 hypothetical protein PTSG_08203 [Salpingoeca rosetta]|eukprot:XP_004991227.1 hypothetical protein PTSG_08203 [Salpingoeca rosetta]